VPLTIDLKRIKGCGFQLPWISVAVFFVQCKVSKDEQHRMCGAFGAAKAAYHRSTPAGDLCTMQQQAAPGTAALQRAMGLHVVGACHFFVFL